MKTRKTSRNPIRGTVANYIVACKRRIKKPKMTLIEFFEDLENRGPSIEDILFEKWTKKIRTDMEKAKTWKHNPSNDFEFVAEYVSRLFRLFKESKQRYFIVRILRGRCVARVQSPEALIFRTIYLKIRVWGLRTKKFRLMRWLKRSPHPFYTQDTSIWPIDFSLKKKAGEKTFIYSVSPYGKTFFKKEIIQKRPAQNNQPA